MNKQKDYAQHTSNQSDATPSQSTDKGMAKHGQAWPSNRDQERNQSDEARPPGAFDNKRERNQLAVYNIHPHYNEKRNKSTGNI